MKTNIKSILTILGMAVGFLAWGLSQSGHIATAEAAVGQGFNLNESDIRFILKQIRISERHAGTRSVSNPCGTLVGNDPDQIPTGTGQTIELPWGLRTVDGSCNHLTPGQENFGTSAQDFPRLLPKDLRLAEDGTSYTQISGPVRDSQPRVISNLVVSQAPDNPAAVKAAGEGAVLINNAFFIPNVAPDAGLSAPYNSWFTLFGQFFDHGLDLVKKGGNGSVFIPLKPDDPLFAEASAAGTPFMLLSRATHGGDHEASNQTSPWVDQSQTYSSHPSHQVFLRQYVLVAGKPVGTGRLITGSGDGMATWADVKNQALNVLGIQLSDLDVLSVPLIATDPYGRFIRGPNGFPQIVKNNGANLVEASIASPISTVDAVPSGHAFLDDIAHTAVPTVPGYDAALLGAHFMAGDGRVNENIGLTAVHHIFHSEHNRLVGDIAAIIATLPAAEQAVWGAINLFGFGAGTSWDYPERLFQAARFVTEMEYQHLAFEEFIRKVQPMVNLFGEGGTGFNASVNPAISAEFAHAVYRFGHSMLTETLARTNIDGASNDLSLLNAFLNPRAFFEGGYTTASQAAGAIVRGMTSQIGNELDEFVTEALRNRLLGLPLDLPVLNLARARETGLPPLNEARRQFYAASLNSALFPYASWMEFGLSIRHSESLVNFVAAYGTHSSVVNSTSVAAKRAAAVALVYGAAGPDGVLIDNPLTPVDEGADNPTVPVPADASDFLFSAGQYAPGGNGRTTTGVDDIDLWVGGLAEKQAVFGGLLGPTFNYVFEKQMEDLQDGDRFYYLSRTAGLNLLVQLEGNSFAELISRNTDAEGLPADVFSRPAFIFKLDAQTNLNGIVDDPATAFDETQLFIRMPDGTIRYSGPEHIVFNGTAGNDRMWASEGDDTLRGNDGNDWMQGGDGNDNLIGGLGDDILFGDFGDDTLKGGDGNDALSSGQGFAGDLNQGGRGNDFIVGGNDDTESFGGPGNDFIFAGDGQDTVFGDDGDDWLEAGRGAFNLLQGDNGAPFANDPNLPGNDVLIGYGGEQDYDSEGGDDIMLMGPGIQRAEGQLGFDWAIHKSDPNPGDSDMAFTVLLPPTVENNRDRFDLTEGLSGWIFADILKGDSRTAADISNGHLLNTEGIARIDGLAALLPVGAVSFSAGNIILGGPGSDILEGRGGDDILDGDRWLDVQIRVIGDRPAFLDEYHDTMASLSAAVFAGLVNPGQLVIVRTIRPAVTNSDIDVAVFSGVAAEYTITQNSNGSVTVSHNGGIDGIDTLWNMETLRFRDGDFTIPLFGIEVTPLVGGNDLGVFKLTNTSPPKTYTVANFTGVSALIDPLTSSNPAFTFAADTCSNTTLAPGNACTFDVLFTPVAEGVSAGIITVASSAIAPSVGVNVTGSGDSIAPTIVLDSVTTFTRLATQTISGTVSDINGVFSVDVSVDGISQGAAILFPGNPRSWVKDITLSNATPAGTANIISVTATDMAVPGGNISAALTATINTDTITPVVSVSAPVSGSLISTRTPVLTFAASDANLAFTTAIVDGLGVGPAPATLASLADGPHTVRLEAGDSAGNIGIATTSFTVDATPPVITVVSPKPVNQRIGITSPVLTFSINDANPDGTKTVVRLDGSPIVNPISGSTTLGPFTAGSAHTLTIDATDILGNISPVNLVTFTIVLADGSVTSLGATPPTIADALITLRHAVQLTTLVGDQFAHADVAPLDANGVPSPDNSVDIADALLILRKVVGLVTSF